MCEPGGLICGRPAGKRANGSRTVTPAHERSRRTNDDVGHHIADDENPACAGAAGAVRHT